MKYSIIALLLFNIALAQAPINEVFYDVPDDLKEHKLMIPRYDLFDPEDVMDGARRRMVIQMNRQAKVANTTLNDVVQKAYPYPYQLASLGDVEAMKEKGYRYFMDMVLMPKQMDIAKREAMVPAYKKYMTANKMYTNKYTQFQYYFYIRDLETNNAYMTTNMKGQAEVYRGIKAFLKIVKKDIEQ